MKSLYVKNQLAFAAVCIAVYCILQSVAGPLNRLIGTEYFASAAIGVIQALVLFSFISKNGLYRLYGLCGSLVPARRFLYYIPLALLATENLWNGAAVNYPPAVTACYISSMVCAGFTEEVLFRGFLFKAMAKDGTKKAAIISSAVFGLLHLLNISNGGGMELAAVLCQAVLAAATGLLFVIIFSRSGSMLPCVVTHSAINTTSAFAKETGPGTHIFMSLIVLAAAAAYMLVLLRTFPEDGNVK